MKQANIVSFRDELTPALRAKLDAMRDKRPVLQAMADAAVQFGTLAFDDSSKRPKPWPNKKDGTPATLKGPDVVLATSLFAAPPSGDMIEVKSDTALAGGKSDRQYARAQNFGYEPRNLPARPFFPILEGGDVFAPAESAILAAMSAAVAKAIE